MCVALTNNNIRLYLFWRIYKLYRCVSALYKREEVSLQPFWGYTYEETRCSLRPFSFPVPHTDTIIGHASRSLCNATPYAFIRAYPHDKHRAVIDICPYRSKGSGIIRPSNNVVGGGYRDHRDNVASPDHNCGYRFLIFTRDMYLWSFPLRYTDEYLLLRFV